MVKLTEKVVLGRARSHSLETVKNLNCWGSELTDVSVVQKMENVEVINARILWLAGNPCCDSVPEEKYRSTVIKALPMLTKLDNVVITNEEFKKAKSEGEDLAPPTNQTEEKSVSKETSTFADTNNKNEMAQSNDAATEENRNKATEKGTSSNEKYQKETLESELRTKTSSVVEETNELRKQLGLKPLPEPSSTVPQTLVSRPATMGQTATSINVLTASLALIREMDEDGLMTLQDAIQDRLHLLQRESSASENVSDTSGSSNMTNGSTADKGSAPEMV